MNTCPRCGCEMDEMQSACPGCLAEPPLARPPGSARLCECPGCGERKPQDKFPDDPAVPGLCAACDLLARSDDEPLEAVHREEAQNSILNRTCAVISHNDAA